MNNEMVLNIGRFVILVLVQVLLLNHINFMGFINPYLYILFIILLPISLSSWRIILLAFLLGLTVDVFGDTGGIHASACLVMAYLRPGILRFAYGISYEHETVKFYKTPLKERLVYVFFMVLIHHSTLFLLTFFSFKHSLLIVKNALFSGLFSILLIVVVTSFFKKVRQ